VKFQNEDLTTSHRIKESSAICTPLFKRACHWFLSRSKSV